MPDKYVIKRVPLDFDYPCYSLWYGYYNPVNLLDCPYCGGTGLGSKDARMIMSKCMTLSDLTQEEKEDILKIREEHSYYYTKHMYELFSQERYHILCLRRLNKDCAHCNGTGKIATEKQRQLYVIGEQLEEPPTGPGYQVWNINWVSGEGGPVSPVFNSFFEACEYSADEYGGTLDYWKGWYIKNGIGYDENNMG